MGTTLSLVGALLLGVVALGAIATVVVVEERNESDAGAENVSFGDGKADILVPVPADPKASYVLVSLESRGGGFREIVTRRHAPDGVRFARHLVQCAPMLAGYVAEGPSEASVRKERPAPAMGVVVAGSITDAIAKFACQGA